MKKIMLFAALLAGALLGCDKGEDTPQTEGPGTQPVEGELLPIAQTMVNRYWTSTGVYFLYRDAETGEVCRSDRELAVLGESEPGVLDSELPFEWRYETMRLSPFFPVGDGSMRYYCRESLDKWREASSATEEPEAVEYRYYGGMYTLEVDDEARTICFRAEDAALNAEGCLAGVLLNVTEIEENRVECRSEGVKEVVRNRFPNYTAEHEVVGLAVDFVAIEMPLFGEHGAVDGVNILGTGAYEDDSEQTPLSERLLNVERAGDCWTVETCFLKSESPEVLSRYCVTAPLWALPHEPLTVGGTEEWPLTYELEHPVALYADGRCLYATDPVSESISRCYGEMLRWECDDEAKTLRFTTEVADLAERSVFVGEPLEWLGASADGSVLIFRVPVKEHVRTLWGEAAEGVDYLFCILRRATIDSDWWFWFWGEHTRLNAPDRWTALD